MNWRSKLEQRTGVKWLYSKLGAQSHNAITTTQVFVTQKTLKLNVELEHKAGGKVT